MKVLKNSKKSVTTKPANSKSDTKTERFVLSNQAVSSSDPYISIGDRGTALITARTLPPGAVVGENQQLPKVGRDENTAPWLVVRSWISPRGKTFAIFRVSEAIKRKLVVPVKNVKWVQKSTGKEFVGTAYFPTGWKPGMRQPQNVAVLNKNWPSGRVESKLVNEAPKNGVRPPARNLPIVGTFKLA